MGSCAGGGGGGEGGRKGVLFYTFILYFIVEESADEPQWLMASKDNGKRGLVPSNYVEMLP